MKPSTISLRTAAAAAALLVLAFTCAASAGGVDDRAAFEKIKGLAGEWQGTTMTADGPATAVRYQVTAGGSAVIETQFAGSEHEMVNVFHLAGDTLVATHYCHSGNQPRLKLDRAASTADTLVFAFDGGTSFDPAKDGHIHSGRIAWKEGGRLEEDWTFYQGGKEAGAAKLLLGRK